MPIKIIFFEYADRHDPLNRKTIISNTDNNILKY